MKQLLYVVLVFAYVVYFGIAMDHEFGDEQSIRLLFCTVAVVVFIIIHFVTKHWGKQINARCLRPFMKIIIQPKWHIMRW